MEQLLKLLEQTQSSLKTSFPHFFPFLARRLPHKSQYTKKIMFCLDIMPL